jgi:hypothetical protein
MFSFIMSFANEYSLAIILIFYFKVHLKILLNSCSKARGITIKHKLSACHTMIEKIFQILTTTHEESHSSFGL